MTIVPFFSKPTSYVTEPVDEEVRPLLNKRVKICSPLTRKEECFSLQEVALAILIQLEEGLPVDSYRAYLGGSSVTQFCVDKTFLCSDIDVKIDLVKANIETILSVEQLFKKALRSLFKEENSFQSPLLQPLYLSPKQSLATYHLEAASKDDLPVEISVNALSDWDVPTHVLNSDSFCVELTAQKLTSLSPYFLYSKEGDVATVKQDVRSHKISSCVAKDVHGKGWFRVLRRVTAGGEGLPIQNNKDFYASDAKDMARIFHNMSDFIEKKHLSEFSIFYKCNALFHCPSEDRWYPFFVDEFCSEVKKLSETKPWISCLHQVLVEADREQVRFFVQRLIPVFADKVSLKRHLEELFLHCEFEGNAYVMIPLSKESEKEILGDKFSILKELYSDKELKRRDSRVGFVKAKLLVTFPKLSIEELRSVIVGCKTQGFLEEDLKCLIKSVPEIVTTLVNTPALAGSCFDLIEQLLPHTISMQEKTRISCGLMKQVLLVYKTRLDVLPSSLWGAFVRVTSSAIDAESNLKPWKGLFVFLMLNFPDIPSEAMSRFCGDLSAKTDSFHFTECLEFFQTEEDQLTYCLEVFDLINQPSSVLDLLRWKPTEKSLQFAQSRLFKNQRKDPFHFNEVFSSLLKNGDVEKVSHLLAYQKGASVSSSILGQEKMAWLAYHISSCTFEMAGFLEKKYLLKEEASESLKAIVQVDQSLNSSYQKMLSLRMKHYSKEKKVVPSCVLVSHLEVLQMGSYSLAGHLSDLLDQCGDIIEKQERAILEIETRFPLLWSPILEQVKNLRLLLTLNKAFPEIFAKVRSGSLAMVIGQLESFISKDVVETNALLKLLVQEASEEEKFALAQKCVDLFFKTAQKDYEVVFALALQEISDLKSFLGKCKPSNQSCQNWFVILLNTQFLSSDLVEVLFGKITDYTSLDSKALICQMVSYFNVETEALLIERTKDLLKKMLVEKEEKELLSCMSFVMDPKLAPILLGDEAFVLLGKECFSLFEEKLGYLVSRPGFDPVKQVEYYIHSIATHEEKASLAHKCCDISFSYYSKTYPLFRVCTASISELKPFWQVSEKWSSASIKNGLEFLKTDKIRMQEYVEIVLGKMPEYSIEILQKMIPYVVSEESKLSFISQSKEEAFKILANDKDIEEYLSFILRSEVSSFLQDIDLHRDILKLSRMYVLSEKQYKKRDQLTAKILGFIKKEAVSEKIKLSHLEMAFACVNVSPLRAADKEWIYKQIEECSDQLVYKLSQKISLLPIESRIYYIQILDQLLHKIASPEVALEALGLHLKQMAEESFKKEVYSRVHPTLMSLVGHVKRLRLHPKVSLSRCVGNLNEILRNHKSIVGHSKLSLIKDIHVFRLRHVPSSSSGSEPVAIETFLDFFIYLGLLKDIRSSMKVEQIASFIKMHDLFLDDELLYQQFAVYKKIIGTSEHVDFLELVIETIQKFCFNETENPCKGALALLAIRLMLDQEKPRENTKELVVALFSCIAESDWQYISFYRVLDTYAMFINQNNFDVGFFQNELVKKVIMPIMKNSYEVCVRIDGIPTERELFGMHNLVVNMFCLYLAEHQNSYEIILVNRILWILDKIIQHRKEGFPVIIADLEGVLEDVISSSEEDLCVNQLRVVLNYAVLLNRCHQGHGDDQEITMVLEEKITTFLDLFSMNCKRMQKAQTLAFSDFKKLNDSILGITNPAFQSAFLELQDLS